MNQELSEKSVIAQLTDIIPLHIIRSEELDSLTSLIADHFHTPAAFITQANGEPHWSDSFFQPSDKKESLHAVVENMFSKQAPLIICNLKDNEQYSHHPFVKELPEITFYAGHPLYSKTGRLLGALSLIDRRQRDFSEKDKKHFHYFAKILERYFQHQEESRHIKSIEDSLLNSESMFIQTFNLAAVGMANVSLTGKWLKVNPKLCDMLGYSEQEMLEKTFIDVTHPDDLHIGFQLIDDLLNDRIHTYTTEKRYINKQGNAFWILLSVSLVRDIQGNPSHFISAVMNINEKVEAENALKKLADELDSRVEERTEQLRMVLNLINQEVEKNIECNDLLNIERDRLKEITDNVPALISCVNHDLHYTFANKTYGDWFNIPPAEIIGQYVPDVVGKASFHLAERYLSLVIHGQKVVYENQFTTREGVKHVQTTLIPNPDPSRREFYVLSLDISELKHLQDSLIAEASHDALTGLPNRRAFMGVLQRLLHGSQPHWIALFFMDLDRFKAINDNHGHEFGDRVLQTVAQVLKRSVRPGDIAARLAGDEFTILLHCDSHPQAIVAEICKRLLDTLSDIKLIGETPVQLSMSIGVAISKNGPDVTPEWLLSQADKAMYQVKTHGRGTYRIIEGN